MMMSKRRDYEVFTEGPGRGVVGKPLSFHLSISVSCDTASDLSCTRSEARKH